MIVASRFPALPRKGSREKLLFLGPFLKIPSTRFFASDSFFRDFSGFEQHILHEQDILCTSTCGRLQMNSQGAKPINSGVPIRNPIVDFETSIEVVDLWRKKTLPLCHTGRIGWWPGWWKPFESMTWLRFDKT